MKSDQRLQDSDLVVQAVMGCRASAITHCADRDSYATLRIHGTLARLFSSEQCVGLLEQYGSFLREQTDELEVQLASHVRQLCNVHRFQIQQDLASASGQSHVTRDPVDILWLESQRKAVCQLRDYGNMGKLIASRCSWICMHHVFLVPVL